MDKVKFLTDSGSDITFEEEKEYGIDIINFQIALEDKSYLERVDFTNEEFYKMIRESDQIPKHLRLPHHALRKILEYAKAGIEDLIVVLINSTGSQTYDNAVLQKNNIYEENPELESKFRIHIVDSHAYTLHMDML